MRIWFKIWKENHLVTDCTVEDMSEDTRTHKIFRALEEACHQLDLAKPIWLDGHGQRVQAARESEILSG